ncbi:MAG: winged helix-turn-helix transcriptional regulator [Chitinophagaceae bacterium]|nr:winged helix-turn-helix transcriptional regulator [Chitinophagaceae bacterium]
MKPTLPFVLLVAAGLLLLAFAADTGTKSNFEEAKEVMVMRKIAHRILQYTGDSTSRVLPVKQLSQDEFQIPFDISFTFKPDSLVEIIDRVIAESQLPSQYIVKMQECGSDEVIYGYAFLGSDTQNIVPCSGRQQPNMRYCLNIRFHEEGSNTARTLYISGFSLITVGLLLFGMKTYRRRKFILKTPGIEPDRIPQEPDAIAKEADTKTVIVSNEVLIGKFMFNTDEQKLTIEGQKIVLTIKESKLLSIFAAALNQTVDRSRLQKEVWEDEGVIVGRSLDMFISRLRKKLEADPNVKLSNIHGKGYKLEIML